MGKIRVRKEIGKLQFDFHYQGVRCREQTLPENTPANRKRLEAFMAQIDKEIKQKTFDYQRYLRRQPASVDQSGQEKPSDFWGFKWFFNFPSLLPEPRLLPEIKKQDLTQAG
ncbi:MAG: DUF3596 domain-containing protein [Deltaproteobacteria bacterium]|nr:DUF3596 domain-containing protein [Deltaproteobacteria bacterium]